MERWSRTEGFRRRIRLRALSLVTPFSLLSWNAAYALWLAVNLALFVVMLLALVALAGLSFREPSGILLVAATLALAPFHTGIVTGNVTWLAVELSVIAIWSARRRHDLAAGFLLAVAAGLKPQIGLCFLLYYLLRRRWRVTGAAAAVLALRGGIRVRATGVWPHSVALELPGRQSRSAGDWSSRQFHDD